MNKPTKAIAAIALVLTIIGCTARDQTDQTSIEPERNLVEQVMRGDIDSIKSVVRADNALANLKRGDGIPLLHFAAANGHAEIVSYLIDMGADIDFRTDYGSALHVAAKGEYVDVVEELLDRKVDVNLKNSWNQTPLHYTTQNRTSRIAELLIANGANVAAKDYRGCTPLHRCKSRMVAEVLINNGANVNEKDLSGYTFLHWAGTPREIVDQATIECLIDHGADLSARDNDGFTPRELAMKNGQKDLIAILDTYIQ